MNWLNDLRLELRRLWQSPGHAVTAALTLALAIGANSAIFSAVHAVLLRPLPVESPDDLAVVWQTDTGGQAVVELTYRHLREWTTDTTVFSRASVMASHNWSAVLEGRGEPSRLWFAGVSAAFFDVLGVRPVLGRGLRAEDDVPNSAGVAVLNHRAWVRRFGADPAIVGKSMTLDGNTLEIVGVMPAGFDLPRGAELWTPAVPIIASGTPPRLGNLDTFGVFYVVGRLRPGLDVASAKAALDALEKRLDAAPGRLKWGDRVVATSFVDHVFGTTRPALWALSAAVGVLLIIACANVSGLMLTRVSLRRREHGIRLALGATRAAIGRLWVLEILIVALAGGLLGLGLASMTARAITALAPDDLPRLGDISINAPVALFTFATILTVALLVSAIPIRHAGAVTLTEALDGSRATAGRHTMRARSAMLVLQIGLAVVLLVAAGLVVRSFTALRHVDLGFSPDRVLTAVVQPRGASVPPNRWLNEFLVRARALPGVEAAGAVYLRPLMLGPIGQGVRVSIEGQPETRQAAEANPTLNHQIATPGYFEAMRIPLRRGRFFTDGDTPDAPRVAIVGESTARRLWPGQDPLGRKVLMAAFTPGSPPRAWRTVVGVVSDVRYRGIDEVQLDIYDPALQVGRPADNVVIRTTGDPMAIAPQLRTLARELDAASLVDEVATMDAVVRRAQAPWRLSLWMFVLFGILAFGLAALGLFSLVAQDVVHRRREFAVRSALGASRGAILGGVLLRAGWRVLAGVVSGVIVALLATRAMRSVLFEVAPADLATYVGVITLVLVVVAVAAYVPARRAARSDPRALL